jgi:hypothetical protein
MEENPWQLRQHFVSYRWEGGEHEEWVRAFAAGLRSRGYPVILDRELMEAQGAAELRVEQITSLLLNLGSVTHFTPIITPGYRERVLDETGEDWRDGWVHDEWTIALNRAADGDLVFDGVWRSGEASVIPAPFDEHNVADFRGNDLEADLDRWYPRLEVNVVGERYDGTVRLIGPILYTEYPQAVEVLRPDAPDYRSVRIVPVD